MISLIASSKEFLFAPVAVVGTPRATVETWPVAFAFLTVDAEPDGSTTWHPGAWDLAAATLTARLLVGPGGGAVQFASGDRRRVYLRITGGSEALIIAVGLLTVASGVATYSGDPSSSNTDAARFEIGDTGPVFDLTDAEIDFAVTRAGGVLAGAADLADALAGRYARRAEQESAGDVSVNWGKRADTMMKLASRLRDRAAGEIGNLGVDAPIGFGLADTTASGVPYFRRGMHDFPGVEGADVAS